MKRPRQLTLFADYAEAADEAEHVPSPPSEQTPAALALAPGARHVPGWSLPEEKLTRNLPPGSPVLVERIRDRIASGDDPLGDQFCSLRLPAERRKQGATFTALPIVGSMLDWAEGC